MRTALNAVSEDWETFVQSILGRAALPFWADMWAILRQEEIKRITKRQDISGGSGKAKVKEEEEDAALSSREKKQQGKKKKDHSKFWCFNCGDLGHFASIYPKKKDKGASDSKATATTDDDSDDDAAMSVMHLERRGGVTWICRASTDYGRIFELALFLDHIRATRALRR